TAARQRALHRRFRDHPLPDRDGITFAEDEVLYDLGDTERNFLFIVRGVVKTGTITDSGREIIYDIRKEGDIVGEMCALESIRTDRAVALEPTQAIAVPFDQTMKIVSRYPALLGALVQAYCSALAEARDQVNRLACANVEQGLIRVLRTLARKYGRSSGEFVEITLYLTQEELSQMVVARRERVSTSLNSLRRRGIARYSPRGRLLLHKSALEAVRPE
ncbi:MAG TPA: Crp/Fnr family transcriptional regulator, partial [Woeseiaceae bacterium]|nr:Crp/Fnr family transcriptional regulator [Woeseiaceae bacterium]